MRRKDKPLKLRPGNAPPKKKSRFSFKRTGRFRKNSNIPPYLEHHNKKKPKPRSKTTILILIVAVVAFIIGAGLGTSLTFEEAPSEEHHVENVTVAMTKNIHNNNSNSTNSSVAIFDQTVDNVDYNNLSNNKTYDNEYYETYSDDYYSYDYGEEYSEY